MNFRLTAIFFSIVVVLVVALLLLVLLDTGPGPVNTDAGLLEPLARAGVKEKDVDTVELVRTEPVEETLTFVKAPDGKWELSSPFRGKADSFAVDALVRSLFQARPTRYPDLTSNLSIHGLDRPTVRITVKSGADKAATVNLGLTTIGGDKAVTFVTTSAAPQRPLAVRTADLSGVFRDSARGKDGPAWQLAKWVADYRPRRLLAADARDPASELQAVRLTLGGTELALARGEGGVWRFTAPAGWGEADDLGESTPQPGHAPITGVRPLLNALTGLQAGPEDYIDRPGDLAAYGLKADDPNVVRVELRGKDATEVLYLGQPVLDKDKKPAVPLQVFARLEGDPAVVKVQTDRGDAIRATIHNPGELRNKELIAPAKRDRIDVIDLTVGKDTVRLRKVAQPAGGPKWMLYGGPGDPQEAKQTEVNGLLTELTRPRAAREVLPEKNDAAFAPPEVRATVRVWVDGIDDAAKAEPGKPAPEPTPKGTPVELVFGKAEGETVFVRRTADQTTTDLKVPGPLLAKATKSRLDFVDPRLKSFDPARVERLAFNRGQAQFEIARSAGTTPWVFVKPDDRKDKSADPVKVFNLIGQLSALPVERVVAEQPSAEELKKWGLDPAAPRMKVAVTLGDPADKERVYLFGADAEGGKSVHAQQVGSPVVFLVPKAVFDRFATDDLRDPTLFRLDAARVKKLKLRGWKGAAGPQVYQFEKQGAGWVAVEPTPKDFAPDSGKLTALLGSLLAPRADSFVDVALKPQYGLDPAQNPEALEITVEQDGAPPVVLVLGSKADGGKVYGMSSGVPGEVFTIDATGIRRYTDKPESLKK